MHKKGSRTHAPTPKIFIHMVHTTCCDKDSSFGLIFQRHMLFRPVDEGVTLTSHTSHTLLTRMSNISDFFIAVLVIEVINHPVNDSAYSDVLLPCQESDSLPGLLRYGYGGLYPLYARMDGPPATSGSLTSSFLSSNHTS